MLAIIGPGLLVAATGVGAGDLATAAFAGSRLGVTVLWAVLLGAVLKFVLTEGLARWQLVTGETLLEGAMTRLGAAARIGFIIYLLPWSFFVGAALISACGVTMHAMLPIFDDPAHGKLAFGAAHSILGIALVWKGGFKLFERVMAIGIAVMFAAVIVTAIRMGADWPAVGSGLITPRIHQFNDGGLIWTIALMGGIGGTLTILCYGYWIREEQREGVAQLRTCRIDLAVAYLATALFGVAMVIIASGMKLDGGGSTLIVALGDRLHDELGPTGRWVFLIGAWAAVFSSLMGVWQAAPYIFADFWGIVKKTKQPQTGEPIARAVNTRGVPYRAYLLAIALIPLLQVGRPFKEVQKYYAVVGAAFIPILAIALFVLNGKTAWIGRQYRNRPWTSAVLILTVLVAILAGYLEVKKKWAPPANIEAGQPAASAQQK